MHLINKTQNNEGERLCQQNSSNHNTGIRAREKNKSLEKGILVSFFSFFVPIENDKLEIIYKPELVLSKSLQRPACKGTRHML